MDLEKMRGDARRQIGNLQSQFIPKCML